MEQIKTLCIFHILMVQDNAFQINVIKEFYKSNLITLPKMCNVTITLLTKCSRVIGISNRLQFLSNLPRSVYNLLLICY